VNWLRNLKLSTKLFLSFGVVIGVTTTLGVLSMGRLNIVAGHSHELATNWLPSVQHLSALNTAKSDVRVAQLRVVTAANQDEATQFQKVARDYVGVVEQERQAYVPLISSPEERAIYERFAQQWQSYMDGWTKVVALSQAGKTQEAAELFKSTRDQYESLSKALQEDVDLNRKGGEDESAAAAKVYADARSYVMTLIGVAVAFAIVVALLVTRAISAPLSRALEIFKRISDGHLDNEIDTTGRDEMGQLLAGLDDMQSKMRAQLATERKMAAESKGQLTAIGRAQAVIEFQLDGTVLTANENFLHATGYSLEEIKGRHHSMFVDAGHRNSDEYRRFWEKLGRGEYDSGQYLRVGKGGRELWLQASYNPILDADGKPYKVVKYASDVTAQVHLTRQMQSAVEETQIVVKAAADGDLTRRLDAGQRSGDLRTMSDGINSLLDNMADIITRIKSAASEVHRGAEEISSGNANLSQRTEEQSSSLEETASSMEEMTTTVKQNADNAGQANQLAMAARDQAEKGGSVVGKAVRAMSDINDSSKKIADIIGVIDEIAFQTNLLALNAAVEAARAGEQGRGFAVVASEVRSLAGRSATAAKEIKDLIQDSVKKVEDGSTLVTQSGQTLEQIVTSVKKVSDIVAEIASASREQSSGIEQVNRAVMQMDELTQQNAALVEQATAASQAMAEQARSLTNLMDRYTVQGGAFESSASTAVSTPSASAKPFVERRGPNRPWSGKNTRNKKSSPAAAPEPRAAKSAPVAAANGDTDTEWREF
jgi:PAS domain S-box-containing protein